MRIANGTDILQTELVRFDTVRKDLNEKKYRKYRRLQQFSNKESGWVSSLHPNKLLCVQMMASKVFKLSEDDGTVIACLKDGDEYCFEHTITGMPNPRVRAPRYPKEANSDNCDYRAARERITKEKVLEESIQCVNHEITNHLHEIRKSIRRIQSLVDHNIKSREILDEIEKDT